MFSNNHLVCKEFYNFVLKKYHGDNENVLKDHLQSLMILSLTHKIHKSKPLFILILIKMLKVKNTKEKLKNIHNFEVIQNFTTSQDSNFLVLTHAFFEKLLTHILY